MQDVGQLGLHSATHRAGSAEFMAGSAGEDDSGGPLAGARGEVRGATVGRALVLLHAAAPQGLARRPCERRTGMSWSGGLLLYEVISFNQMLYRVAARVYRVAVYRVAERVLQKLWIGLQELAVYSYLLCKHFLIYIFGGNRLHTHFCHLAGLQTTH